ILFGVLTLAFGSVSVFTGRSVLGWIGIVGLPSVLARLALAAGVVGFGIWRALQAEAKVEPEGPRTPEGTEILPAERFSRKAIVGACLIPCVFFLLLAFVVITGVPAERIG